MNHQKTAVIAGGGLAGLAAAVCLDEQGYQVTLVERQKILGGRAYSFRDRITGLTVDNGQHLMMGAYHDTICFLEKVGAKHHLEFQIPTVVPLFDQHFKRSDFKLGLLRPPFHLLKAMLGFKGLKWSDKLKLLRLHKEIQSIQKGQRNGLSEMTVRQWLNRLGQSAKAQKNFWDVLTLATLNDDPENTSADGLACVLKKSFFAERQSGYAVIPKVGLSELFVEPAERYLEMRGQKVLKGVGLKAIRVLDKRVQSFRMSDGLEVKADLFVSALPFTQLSSVLSETLINSNERLAGIRCMQGSPIVSIHLFFDRPVMNARYIGSAATQTQWFFNAPRSTDQGPRTLYHIIGVISGAYDLLELNKQEIVSLAAKDLAKLYPKASEAKLVHSLVIKEREATLSSRVGINPTRPSQKIFDNFFVVGDWTQTGLPATIESAVRSARLMGEVVGVA